MTEPLTRESLRKMMEKIANEPIRFERHIYIVSPDYYEAIRKGTALCPCHCDYRHKEDRDANNDQK